MKRSTSPVFQMGESVDLKGQHKEIMGSGDAILTFKCSGYKNLNIC